MFTYFVFTIENMEAVTEKIDVRLQIAEHLKDKGIKRSWLAAKINRSTTLIAFILSCKADLLDENLENINKALGTSFTKD